jgi:DNA polymerase-1
VNTTIQGSAADIVKCAMRDIAAELARYRLETALILQVHDELIFEVPEAELSRVEPLVRNVMENIIRLKVRLKVNIEQGQSWGNIH